MEFEQSAGIYVWQTIVHCNQENDKFTFTVKNPNFNKLWGAVRKAIYEKTQIAQFKVCKKA